MTRDLKIDDAADLDGAVLICMNKKSFLKCGNCNNRLKLILVTCEQFCLAKLNDVLSAIKWTFTTLLML